MKTQYSYDLVISFAEEDRNVAAGIHDCLKLMGINSYYYPDHPEANWGKSLPENLNEIYQYQGRMGILLLSRAYLSKKYTRIEMNAMLARNRAASYDFLHVILLDDTAVAEIAPDSAEVTYMKWAYNPLFFAELIRKKLPQTGFQESAFTEKELGSQNSQQATGNTVVQSQNIQSKGDLNIG